MKSISFRYLLACVSVILAWSSHAYTASDCTVIDQLANNGIVNYQNNCSAYNLDKAISRQEVAAVALKVAERCGVVQNVPPVGQYVCQNMYSDVSSYYPNTWACRPVELLAQNNILSNNGGAFRPLQLITRAEALSIMLDSARLGFRNTSYDDWRFNGSDAVTWQKPLLQFANDRGIISSISAFGPNGNAYRREVFAYAQKALELCPNNGNYNNNNNNNNRCAVGQYWSGNTCYSCGSVPSNGYYATSGSCTVSCYSGYYYNAATNSCVSNYNNTNTTCGLGQYWGGYSCLGCMTKPSSGYYTSVNSCDWACPSGYTKSGNSCVYGNGYNNYSCTVGQYWSGSSCYSCGSTPANGYYGTAGSCTVSCYSGYYYNSATNSCVSNYNNGNTTCGVGQYWSGNTCYSCGSAPYNAYYTTANSCNWSCNSGYYLSGNTCVANYNNGNTCGVGQYWSGNTCYSCGSAPANGYYSTSGSCTVSCYSGYYYNSATNSCVSNNSGIYNNCTVGQYRSGNTCYSCGSTPSNGYYSTAGSCNVTCYSGYYYNSATNSCVSNYNNGNNTCGIGQYWSGNSCYTCSSVPWNGYYTSANSCDWTCNVGYYKSGNSCVANYTGTNYGNCTNIPSNGYCTNTTSCEWSCNAGYYRSGNTCILNNNYGYDYNYNNSCGVSLPLNAYYTNTATCDWACNYGYLKIANVCVLY